AAVHLDLAEPRSCRTPGALRKILEQFRMVDEPRARDVLLHQFIPRLTAVAARHEHAATSSPERERAILRSLPSAARALGQAGVFDQRTIRTSAAKEEVSAARREDAERRVDVLAAASRL